MIAFDAPSFSERMKNGGRSLCRAGEPVNKPHGQINRQNAEKKQGGIAYESKNETAQAAAYAPHPCDGDGTASCHSNAQPIRKKRAPLVLTDLLEAVI